MLFKKLNRATWKENRHNPVKMLRELPMEIFESTARDAQYLKHYDLVLEQYHKDIDAKRGWFTENITTECKFPIAYFSAEYGLHHSLPRIAVGGLQRCRGREFLAAVGRCNRREFEEAANCSRRTTPPVPSEIP